MKLIIFYNKKMKPLILFLVVSLVLDLTVMNYDLEKLETDTNLFLQKYRNSKLSL